LTGRQIGGQINRPSVAHMFSMESHVMRSLLQIDFLGLLHINAEGLYAIGAAVIIVLAFVRWRLR
jgi:hypothetical protein